MQFNNVSEEKLAFAKQWLKYPNDAFKAASEIYPSDIGKALYVATNWPFDPEVLEIKTNLKKIQGDGAFLPDKNDLARSIWDKMQNCMPEDFAKLAKLYAELMGFIEKNQLPAGNTLIQQKVIQITNFGSDENWELAAKKQQLELLNVSRSRD